MNNMARFRPLDVDFEDSYAPGMENSAGHARSGCDLARIQQSFPRVRTGKIQTAKGHLDGAGGSLLSGVKTATGKIFSKSAAAKLSPGRQSMTSPVSRFRQRTVPGTVCGHAISVAFHPASPVRRAGKR